MPNPSKVAILVLPRERYSLVETCLEHIYAFTPEPFQLIVIDGKSPNVTRDRLKRWETKNDNCKVIRSEHFLYPHEAKNLALEHLQDSVEWVVLIDNDVKVSQGWLTQMLKAGEETGAKAVHPLYLIEQRTGVSVHMAEGLYKTVKKRGQEWIQPVMNYVGMNIIHAAQFKRMESDFVEFHCCMVHRDVLRELGPFEDVHLAEDMHFSLKLREQGIKIIFEPQSVITYVAGPPFHKTDYEYFKYRRSIKIGQETIESLKKRWPDVLPEYWDGKLAWLQFHSTRLSPLFPLITKIRRLLPQSRLARKLAQRIPAIRGN